MKKNIIKEYRIEREPNGNVSIYCLPNFKKLDLRVSQKVRNHSPTGFNYGYGGSGPAQTALAILLEHTRSPKKALENYMWFKDYVIAGIPRNEKDWTLPFSFVELFLHYADRDRKGKHNGKFMDLIYLKKEKQHG